MTISNRLKLGLLASVTAATVLGGAGLADAAQIGTAATPAHGAQLDVGTPADGVHPDAAAVAPDGTRITGVTATPFGGHRLGARTREGATPNAARAATTMSAQDATLLDIDVDGARLRAWVPYGTVLGLAYAGETAWGGCQIPGSDGHIWGWVSVETNVGWRSGWMRSDLYSRWDNGNHNLPWC